MGMTVDVAEARNLLISYGKRLSAAQIGKTAAAIIREDIRSLFTEGGDGGSWPPPKAQYRQPKAGKRKRKSSSIGGFRPLWRTGNLRRSIAVAGEGKEWWVQTTEKKAPTLHYGAKQGAFRRSGGRGGLVPWGDIPARPFMVIRQSTEAKIKAALEQRAGGQIA